MALLPGRHQARKLQEPFGDGGDFRRNTPEQTGDGLWQSAVRPGPKEGWIPESNSRRSRPPVITFLL